MAFTQDEWADYWAYLDDELRLDAPRLFRSLLWFDRFHNWYGILRLLNKLGDGAMVRGKQQAKKPAARGAKQWTEWADIPVPPEDWPVIQAKYAGNDELSLAFSNLVSDGYRVSFSLNQQNDTVSCSITCRDDDAPNAGMTLNAFADSWWTALMVACYKHFDLAAGDWRGHAAADDRPKFG